MTRQEAVVVVAGAGLTVVALGAFDWRFGVLLAGLWLVVSVINIPRRTT
jgi:hypothetical protein